MLRRDIGDTDSCYPRHPEICSQSRSPSESWGNIPSGIPLVLLSPLGSGSARPGFRSQRRLFNSKRAVLGTAAGLLFVPAAFAVTLGASFIGPSVYLSFADSPFKTLGTPVFVEDFEDGALNTLGVSTTTPAIFTLASALTDSVDADDGAIDGSGISGRF